jgi:hypothetical protein
MPARGRRRYQRWLLLLADFASNKRLTEEQERELRFLTVKHIALRKNEVSLPPGDFRPAPSPLQAAPALSVAFSLTEGQDASATSAAPAAAHH